MNDIIQFVSAVGFPIVACICMGWYVKYQMDANKEEVREMRKEHQEEVAKVTEALNNNTLALQKLVDKIDNKEVEV